MIDLKTAFEPVCTVNTCTGSMDQRVSCAHRIKGPAGFVRTSDQWTSGLCACTAILHASPLLDRAADGVSHAQSTFLLRTNADPAAIMWPQRQPTQQPTAPKAVCLHVCPACLHVCRRGRCAAFEGPSPPARLLADVWGCFPAGLALVFFPAGLALVFAFLCAFGAWCVWPCATANIRNSCTKSVVSVGLVSRTGDDESVKSS